MSNVPAGTNKYIDVIHSVRLTCFPQHLLTGNNCILVLQLIINWGSCHHFLFLFSLFPLGLKSAQPVCTSHDDPGTLGRHLLTASTEAMQFIVWYICKCNTGKNSFLKCIHNTSVKFNSAGTELTGAPEDRAQLTVKHPRTQGIGTNVWKVARMVLGCLQ